MKLPNFPQVMLPNIPQKDFDIRDFGATAGGMVYNTKAINAAVEKAHTSGGGRVVIPDGIWLSGAITMKSKVELHLKNGALLLLGYDNRDEWPLVITDWEGTPRIRAISPIHATGEKDIAITGSGIIDGAGQWWRPQKKEKHTEKSWNAMVASGGEVQNNVWYPSEDYLAGHKAGVSPDDPCALEEAQKYYRHYRPVLVSFVKCERVLMEGVTFQNSPAWNVHPLFCEHVTMRNAIIRNPWNSQNGDGLDLESCRYCLVENVNFDVCDDAICMKAGKNAVARKTDFPTEFVIIRNCIVYHGHGGFVVGSEMSRGVRNVHISDCTFIGTDAGIRFKTAMGRGGVVENIVMENINMTDIPKEAIIFSMGYGNNQALSAEDCTPEDVPQFQNMLVKNVTCKGADVGLAIAGLEQMTIKGLTFENVNVASRKGIRMKHAENIRFINSTFTNEKNPAEKVVFDDVTTDEYNTEFS